MGIQLLPWQFIGHAGPGQPPEYWDFLALIPPLVLLVHGSIEGLFLAIVLPGRMAWPRARTWVAVGASYLVWAPCLVLYMAMVDVFLFLGAVVLGYAPSVGPVAGLLIWCLVVRGVAAVVARMLGLKFNARAWWRVYPLALTVASCVSLPTLWYLLGFLDTLADKSP